MPPQTTTSFAPGLSDVYPVDEASCYLNNNRGKKLTLEPPLFTTHNLHSTNIEYYKPTDIESEEKVAFEVSLDQAEFFPYDSELTMRHFEQCKKLLVNPHLIHLTKLSLLLIEEEKKYNQVLSRFSDFVHGDSIVGKDYSLEFYTEVEKPHILTLRKRVQEHINYSNQFIARIRRIREGINHILEQNMLLLKALKNKVI